MIVIEVHNYYEQPGGEDRVFAAEAAMLDDHGHRVVRHTRHNGSVAGCSLFALGASAVWNRGSGADMRELIRDAGPQVVHFHNTFPLVSPAAHHMTKREGVAVVQTLHNYRLLCPNGLFFRDGSVCEDCVGRIVAWPGLLHSCYRGSRLATGAVAAMLSLHRVLGTWGRKVDLYIALTPFARRKFVDAGFAPNRIRVKPNFVHPDPGVDSGSRDLALFVGRLSREKGSATFLEALRQLGAKAGAAVVGDGPLAHLVESAVDEIPGLKWHGFQPPGVVHELMGKASFVVVPSEWYEPFGLVVIEAFARGTPVIASNIGGLAELVEHGRTGLHFRPGDAEDLAGQMEWAMSHPEEMARMGREARAEFEAKYTAERNYALLMDIYEEAIEINARG